MTEPIAEHVAEPRETLDALAAAFPLVIERGAQQVHRLWAAALFCRTLDGYDAVLRLHESGLDAEARAHSRIAFDHLLGFAWVVARPGDAERPLRIAHHGTSYFERRMAELASYGELSPPGLAASADGESLEPPPATQELCGELDLELAPRMKGFHAGTPASFSGWYSYFYREGSAFVHPSPAGIEDLFEEVAGGVRVAPFRGFLDDVVGLARGQLMAAQDIARVAAPWLLDPGRA